MVLIIFEYTHKNERIPTKFRNKRNLSELERRGSWDFGNNKISGIYYINLRTVEGLITCSLVPNSANSPRLLDTKDISRSVGLTPRKVEVSNVWLAPQRGRGYRTSAGDSQRQKDWPRGRSLWFNPSHRMTLVCLQDGVWVSSAWTQR